MSIEIVEITPEERCETLLFGFPGVGLVGVISTDHIIKAASLKRTAKVDSREFPPIVRVVNGMAAEPISIYSGSGLYVMKGDVALPLQSTMGLITFTLDWFVKKKGKLAVMIEGIASENRLNKEKPEVFKIYSDEEAKELAINVSAKPLPEGFVSGHIAYFIREAIYRGIPAVAVLVECFPAYPDPGAAAEAIESLKPVINLDIDVNPLIERSEVVRHKMRELMRQAMQVVQQTPGKAESLYIG